MFEITKNTLINIFNMPIGTKYKSFNKSKDLKIGNFVYASKFAGKEIGNITEIIDNQFCKINGKLTFISDIIYIKDNTEG